jgi:uncharacterized protein (DUF952 family)
MIYHITTSVRWAAAQSQGRYEADSLASDGFIHCSTEGQVARVANGAFRVQTGLVVLHIDEAALGVPVRYENLEGGEELFPHVYGPLPATAVTMATPLVPGPSGEFAFSAD